MELDSGHASMPTTQLPSEAVMDIAECTKLQSSSSSGIVDIVSGFTRTTSPTDDCEEKEKIDDKKDIKRSKLNRIIVTALLVIATLLMNACSSVIEPYYPKEVMKWSVHSLCN